MAAPPDHVVSWNYNVLLGILLHSCLVCNLFYFTPSVLFVISSILKGIFELSQSNVWTSAKPKKCCVWSGSGGSMIFQRKGPSPKGWRGPQAIILANYSRNYMTTKAFGSRGIWTPHPSHSEKPMGRHTCCKWEMASGKRPAQLNFFHFYAIFF